MLDLLTVSAAIAALLLADAGLAKLRAPAATSEALRLARLPDRAWLVRSLGAGEVALAVAVLAVPGPLPVAILAVAYAAFAIFSERQRRAGSSCGCFGVEEAPLTLMHVVVDAGAAFAATAAAAVGAPPLLTRLGGSGVPATVAAVAAALLGAVAVRHLLTTLPRLSSLTDAVLEVPDA